MLDEIPTYYGSNEKEEYTVPHIPNKEHKSFKEILKNMHPTIDIKELTEEIEKENYKVVRLSNISRTKSDSGKNIKIPSSTFFVELEQRENNKEIYKIKQLLHMMVTFEQPCTKRDIAQCMRCQKYGHTKNYCYRNLKCVKCAGDHLTVKCKWKDRRKDVICCNCNGNHPASYKGCVLRKQLQQKLYPQLQEKDLCNKILR